MFGQTNPTLELGWVKMQNYFTVTADLTSATWNTVAAHEIVTVTGMVRLLILPEITGSVTSTGGTSTLTLGDETTTNSIIPTTDAETLLTGGFWQSVNGFGVFGSGMVSTDFLNVSGIFTGKDIGYTIGTEALTGGSIKFHVYWEEIGTSGGTCTAGAGGAL